MKTRIRSVGAAAAVAALTASVLLATPGTAQAADTATITVNVVDQFGQPATTSVVAVHGETNEQFYDSPPTTPLVSSTHLFQELPAGGYSFVAIGPWNGFECFGASPCTNSVFSGGTIFTPVTSVVEGGAGSYTMKVVMPTVTGDPAVGSALTIQTSPGYKYMQGLAAQQTGQSGEHTQQWLRGTAAIPAAAGPSYTTTPADANKQVAARLSPSPGIASVFGNGGHVVQPYTTGAVTVAKAPTRTKAKFLGDAIKVKVKAGPGAVPEGKVKLSLGKLKIKAKLKKGKVTFALPPKLAPGQYTLKVRYLGSPTFKKSKSTKNTITIS